MAEDLATKPVKQPGETNTQFNERLTQWYKDQPEPTLSDAQKKAGAYVKFVRTGKAGEGEYKILYPIGAKFDPISGEPTDSNSGNAADGSGMGNAGGFIGNNPRGFAAGQSTVDNSERQSAYDLLYEQFNQYGLGNLVEGIKGLITQNIPASEFALRLRQTDAYKKRFAANAQRIAKGLGALTEAEYIGLEDQYQNIMRNYGLPASYYERGDMGIQLGFEKFLANDVSAAELEDRIMTAQKRVINANPEVSKALKQFYPDITNGDILAYTLDPTQGLEAIKRKVTAAEIGGAAMAQGLTTGVSRAEELARYGVTKESAQQGFETVAQVAPRGGQLAAIYGEDPYTQATAESEVFSLAGSAEARKKREKLSALETSSFSGQSGLTQGALARDRAGAY
jgi:hypothetical protein